MASHLLFFRLPKGRVWHVACSGAQVALCGQSIPSRGERQPKRPPFGARPCPDCDNVSTEARTSIDDAWLRRRLDDLPSQDTVILDESEMVSRAFLGTPLPMVVEPSMTGSQAIVGDFGGGE